MTDVLQRPLFFEGQVLAAADLELAVESARGQLARHERYLHTWGIAHGLELTGVDRTVVVGGANVPCKDVTVAAGVAIDGHGREVIVSEPELLSTARFDDANLIAGQPKDAWFPVFLVGQDEDAPLPPLSVGACESGGTTRRLESHDIEFGRPGDELDLDEQTKSTIPDGPGEGHWRILLGHVQWDDTIQRFKDVSMKQPPRPRYAGVLADEVASRGGTLTIRSGARPQSGKPVLEISDAGGGQFTMGLLNSAGAISTLATINSKGDLTLTGSLIQGTIAGLKVFVQSGSVSDGAVLPLPAGVTQQQVTVGQVELHMHVTPRVVDSALMLPTHLLVPLHCTVDPSTRVVDCRFRRFDLTAGAPLLGEEPGACDYTVIAVAP